MAHGTSFSLGKFKEHYIGLIEEMITLFPPRVIIAYTIGLKRNIILSNIRYKK